MNRSVFPAILSVLLAFVGCDKKEDDGISDDSVLEDSGIVGANTQQPEENSSVKSSILNTEGCSALANGATERQRFEKSKVVIGLDVCNSEQQTVSCSNGVETATGTYTQLTCEPVLASVVAGDILVMKEGSANGENGKGQIMAFSPSEGYRGYAFASAGIVPWYSYGLRLTYNYFSENHQIEVGSSDANLAIQVNKFAELNGYPHTLANRMTGASSDATYFQGTFSEIYNTSRHVAVENGRKIDVYSWESVVPDCQIAMPAGKHARAIYSGTQYNFFNVHIAYTLGSETGVTGYGVGKLTGSCNGAGGTPQTFTTLFEETYADAKITSVLQVRTTTAAGSGSWRNDILITVGGFLYGQTVVQWHYDTGTTTWSKTANQFTNTPKAVFQDGLGDVYALELDAPGGESHLRRYGVEETAGVHLKATLYSEPDETLLDNGSLGTWIVVMPTLPD